MFDLDSLVTLGGNYLLDFVDGTPFIDVEPYQLSLKPPRGRKALLRESSAEMLMRGYYYYRYKNLHPKAPS